MLRLAISLDLNVIEIIKIKGSGELRLNTTDLDAQRGRRDDRRPLLPDPGHRRAAAARGHQDERLVHARRSAAAPVNVGQGDSFTASTLNLQPGEWVIEVSRLDGLLRPGDAVGARLDRLQRPVRAAACNGELVLGSRSFGLVGDFNFGVKLTRDINPACNGQTGQTYENCIRNNPGQFRFRVT